MLIDDVPDNLNLLSKMLETRGYKVRAFLRGEQALKAARRSPPDIVLLDVTMPEMDGFEVCSHFKADTSIQDIPVLFISGLTETSDKIKAFAVGGVDYITKPFQIEEIHARVDTHLHLRKLQHELEMHNQHLEELVREKVKEISDSQLATIYALSKLAESRDDETGFHIERTQILCKLLGRRLYGSGHFSKDINATFIEDIYQAAALHDIGKVGIPDCIFLKPSKLTSEEFEIMKTHTTVGAQTLKIAHNKYPRNTFLRMGIEISQSHHEKWDGSGYPAGLVGNEIPLPARIMSVVDAYDALRSKRPYKAAFSHEKSVDIIREGSGKHFDPVLVSEFMSIEGQFRAVRDQMDSGESRESLTMYQDSAHMLQG